MFLNVDRKIIYVGKAKNLKARVSSYFTNIKQLGEKTRALTEQIDKIKIVIVESELESLLLEAFYIKKYKPKYNIRLTDSKSYLLIRITVKDRFPAVLLARRMDDPNSLYFGPYPNSQAIKSVLKTLRRIFPFMSTINHPARRCLYNHLDLCPCLPFNDTREKRKENLENLKNIIRILEGGTRKLLKELEKDRELASKNERFEEALILQKRINALRYITQPFYQPIEYDLNPNLREDIRHKELTDLRKILEHAGYLIEKEITRIECYDISHIQGTNTTGSMVVFINGEKESSQYRKYRIRHLKTPDDFASMREVLTRRFRHTEWDYPDLLVIDGGKGQVSATLDVLRELQLQIPLIGLAKRIETIVIPTNHPKFILDKKENFREVVLPHELGALKLLMRIRDEAHRFAITYHRKLRSKAAIS